MATIPTNDEIGAAFAKASKAVQEYIGSTELMSAFIGIRDHYKLHLDEAGNISRALNAVFLGVRPAAEFPELLKAALEQNSGAYGVTLKDINEKIFVPFRRKMQEKGAAPPSDAQTLQKPLSPIERLEERVMGDAERGVEKKTAGMPPLRPSTPPPQPQTPPATTDPYRESIG